ncbi:MAG: inorganic pyrophosphatase [Bacteroidales bacterium]|nr:inorganic pyrophosphatase [Bacteroidales bacterium]MCF8387047.1 inorganic pyrophosphatase [Bacteroidales bacterium]MCF8397678.1 inorganic pyrophosphatase [Bacteroidales bacterium]
MANKIMDPIGRLMGLRYKSHPWHGVDIGKEAPEKLICFVEMVTTDTVKYEVDKETGYLRIDRPQKYSNTVPALYGFVPQTYSGKEVAKFCMEKTGRDDIHGDGDPIDICILTEKEIVHGDILVRARPIGGFRMLDSNQSDDKIIAVLNNDAVYGDYKDISDCPDLVIDRLKHYFLTYKDLPGKQSDVEITHTFGIDEAHEVIRRSMEDYFHKFDTLDSALKTV